MGARELLADLACAGLSISVEGDRLVIRPACRLTDDLRAAVRISKPELLALLENTTGKASAELTHVPRAWSEADIACFNAMRERLIYWRWSEVEAEEMAERLVKRDQQGDDRKNCLECRHHRPGRCANYRRAGFQGPELGSGLAAMLQRCAGFLSVR